MQSVLDLSPGLMFWTLVNFLIFLVIFFFMFYKTIKSSLNDRADHIKNEREAAEKANFEANQARIKAEEALNTIEKEIADMKVKAKVQTEEMIKKAASEAEFVKKQKVDEASREIERTKDLALRQLRSEVADLVVQATEKILGETIDKEKHIKLVDNFIEKLPNN